MSDSVKLTEVPVAPRRGASAQYSQGYRCAMKRAVAWLHHRADEMNDPHAKAILDSAAFNLGVAAQGPAAELAAKEFKQFVNAALDSRKFIAAPAALTKDKDRPDAR